MKEIILVDIYYNHGGHNKIYADTIVKRMNQIEVYIDEPLKEVPRLNNSIDIIKIVFYNIKYLFKIFLYEKKHIHFLFVDNFIKYICLIYPLLIILKKTRGLIITGTYHVFNKNKFMNFIVGLFDGIVVHSDLELEYLKQKVNVNKINYPSFLDTKIEKRNHPDKLRFGFLGGNRKEKNFDLFIKAMNKTQHDIEVVIGGANTDLNINGFELNKQLKIIPRFMTDNELKDLIEYIDVLVLPYDISFKGQSGPLVEAAFAGKVIISSNAPIMKQMVLQYELGEVFESGNLRDLLEKIDNVVLNYDEYCTNKEFWKDYAKNKFINDYNSFFERYQS